MLANLKKIRTLDDYGSFTIKLSFYNMHIGTSQRKIISVNHAIIKQ